MVRNIYRMLRPYAFLIVTIRGLINLACNGNTHIAVKSMHTQKNKINKWMSDSIFSKSPPATVTRNNVTTAKAAKIISKIVDCTKFNLNDFQNVLRTVPSPRRIFNAVKWPAVKEAPIVISGIEKIIIQTFKKIKSTKVEINRNTGPSNSKNLIISPFT